MTFVAKVRHNLYELGLTSLLAVRYMLTQQVFFFLQARQDWLYGKYYYHTKK